MELKGSKITRSYRTIWLATSSDLSGVSGTGRSGILTELHLNRFAVLTSVSMVPAIFGDRENAFA
jgi:hypothetical protein